MRPPRRTSKPLPTALQKKSWWNDSLKILPCSLILRLVVQTRPQRMRARNHASSLFRSLYPGNITVATLAPPESAAQHTLTTHAATADDCRYPYAPMVRYVSDSRPVFCLGVGTMRSAAESLPTHGIQDALPSRIHACHRLRGYQPRRMWRRRRRWRPTARIYVANSERSGFRRGH